MLQTDTKKYQQLEMLLLWAVLCLFAGMLLATNALHAATEKQVLPPYVIEKYGHPPSAPSGSINEDVKAALDTIFSEDLTSSAWGRDQDIALDAIRESGDPQLVWLLSDLMRFAGGGELSIALANASAALLNIEIDSNHWGVTTDHLIAWDIPAPPDYLKYKRAVFTSLVPGWDKLFVEGNIDWRHVSWGGVLIDDRPYDKTDEDCNCIPAADNPTYTQATDAEWLKSTDIVFGVEVNGEYRAYPRQIMEVREMVNDTLGGRQLGIPYCTLCGAAQVYFTDDVPEGVARPVLRTSGLLIRSNKVMYDVNTYSVFDTFKGAAVTGPLAEKNITLKQASVVTTEWGEWKKAHPETTVLTEDLALGRNFDFRNNRDANGPIFPVGNVDPRLPVHEDIIGVLNASGSPVAFQRSHALLTLFRGREIIVDDIQLHLSGGGIIAKDITGANLVSHQAFWFAWSQFYAETKLWVTP